MVNIFSDLQVYGGKWSLKSERAFTADEQNAVASAAVVASQFGNSVCFIMKSGGQTYIPLSNQSQLGVGEVVDLKTAKLQTLEKSGEDDILRVMA